MYGEDASGRKVSLLNDSDDTSTSISTTTTTNHPRRPPFIRPTLPYRAPESASSASFSQRSHEGSNKSTSSRSSISCSPRHSPPTPPLVRLDSRSSLHTLKTPSPMTPHYGFDPLDHHDYSKNQQGGLPYYTNGYQQHNGGDDGNPYPPMHNPHQHAYYSGMNAQQPLPSMYGSMGHAYPPHANMQLQSPLQYPTNHLVNPLGPPTPQQSLSSLPPLPSNQAPIPMTKAKTEPTSAPPATASPVPSVKPDPSPPIKTSTTATSTNTTTNATPKPSNSSSNSKNTANNTATSSGTPTSSVPKKKYPCPHAKEYKCTDTFTTSGHAARHGKKHTGEKNVNCPTCGKAFTRKDNMKQHERTHKPGHGSRGATGVGPSSAANSPTIGVGSAVSGKAKKRTMSGSTMASLASSSSVTAAGAAPANRRNIAGVGDDNGDDDNDDDDNDDDDDDEDADGDVDMEVGMDVDMDLNLNFVAPHQQHHHHHSRHDLTMAPTQAQIHQVANKHNNSSSNNNSSGSNKRQKEQRPPMGKSKLSEILEQVNASGPRLANENDSGSGSGNGMEMDMHAAAAAAAAAAATDFDAEADGEGESPGLDALATVAAGEMDAQLQLQQQQQQQQQLHR